MCHMKVSICVNLEVGICFKVVNSPVCNFCNKKFEVYMYKEGLGVGVLSKTSSWKMYLQA